MKNQAKGSNPKPFNQSKLLLSVTKLWSFADGEMRLVVIFWDFGNNILFLRQFCL